MEPAGVPELDYFDNSIDFPADLESMVSSGEWLYITLKDGRVFRMGKPPGDHDP